MTDDEQKFLNKALDALPFEVNVAAREQLAHYLTLMRQWNKTYNLTAITDFKQQVSHHLLDSLAVLPYIKEGSLLDVGTGAGLPGIPLAIMRPDLTLTLLDSNGKKTRFLVQVVGSIGLKNVTVAHTRVQDHQPAQPFDMIITRAVAVMADTIRDSRHLLKASGQYLFMKGKYPSEELQAVSVDVETHEIDVPLLDSERCLVVLSHL